MWSCKELALPLLVEISDPVNGRTRHRYFEVHKSVAIAPELFKVPEGFGQIGELGAAR